MKKQKHSTAITSKKKAKIKTLTKSTLQETGVPLNTLIGSFNPFLQATLLRDAGNKKQALTVLQSINATKFKDVRAVEIINTYIQFKDYKGAKERFESLLVNNFELQKICLFLDIVDSEFDCESIKIHLNAIFGLLKIRFDCNLFLVAFELWGCFCQNSKMWWDKCKFVEKGNKDAHNPKKCKIEFFDSFEFLDDQEYLEKLSFDEIELVYKFIKSSNVERARIIANPHLPHTEIKNYYSKNKEDLDFMKTISERRFFQPWKNDKRLAKVMNKSIEAKNREGSRKLICFENLRKHFKFKKIKFVEGVYRLDYELD